MWKTVQDQIARIYETISEDCPGGVGGAAAIWIGSLALLQYGANTLALNRTKAKIRRREAKRNEGVENLRKRLESVAKSIDLSVTQIPFKDLQKKLQTGEISCTQVILAFQAKALAIHDQCNCVTGFVADAEERARRLDGLPAGERGPLHGIPVSMKEVVGVAGEDCTAGLSHFVDKIHPEYGVMMQVLIKQGAIPFARTNISQGQVSYSCCNPIYGESCNPVDPTRSPGGSSGGEGVLVGGGGSILGIACDMGGSIRIPSHFCGACGFKPTQNRMSGAGNLKMGHGIVTMGEIFGPLGRDVDTLVSMMKAALIPEMFKLDPLLPQLAWREELYTSSKPMTIGFYTSDGSQDPMPAVMRGVALAKQALEVMGHTVVELTPLDAVNAVAELGFGAIFGDGGKMFKSVMPHDVVDPSISGTLMLPKIPLILRRILAKLLFFMHPLERKLMVTKSCGNVYNWWMLNEKVEEYKRDFTRSMQEKGLDGLMCPTFPVTAWPLKDDFHAISCGTYTMLYNILNFPCGAVTVTRVSPDDVRNMESYPRNNPTDRFVHRIAKGSENLPVTVQAVSYPFQGEVTLRIMKEIERGLQRMGRAYA